MVTTSRQKSETRIGEEINPEVRPAKSNGGSNTSLDINLTDFARKFHGIEPGDPLHVVTHEEAIVITPVDTGDTP